MSESQVYQLDRLYFGHLIVAGNRPSATPGVVARTPNVTPEQVLECLRVAKLSPPTPAESSEDMPGALGLFRGDTTDFILAKAQLNDAGHPQMLYILFPIAPLRALGGSLQEFRSLAMMDMPSFSAVRSTLQPFELRDPQSPTSEEQIDALLDLLLFCQDSFKHVEAILAGLVQGWPLAIVNSPASIEKRLRFVQGLVCLLPVPARVGITFATQVNDPASGMAQIKFTSSYAAPPQHLVYDWGNGKLVTQPPDDSYSHYMIAQLRLDPSLVVEQTEGLSRTAVWRAMHKENLGRALAWVSHRAAIDRTVRDGQPADRDVVAAILREDPTLSDDLRLLYVRHLLAFALALDEPDSADVVPTVCVTNPAIAKAVVDQLRMAADSNQSWTVYTLLERWLLRVPEASALGWHAVLHMVARQYLKELLAANNVDQAVDFIDYVQSSQPALRLREIMPDLVRSAAPAGRTHARLARALFLIAVESLPAGELYRIFSDESFTANLPVETQTALSYLQSEPRYPVPAHSLDAGARVFGDGQRMRVLARFAECAMLLQRAELVDTAALQAVLVVAQSSRAEQVHELIRQIIHDFTQVSVIQVLEPPGPRILAQLLLEIREFDQTVQLLEFYQNTVYGPNRSEDFTQMVGELFRMVTLPPDDLNRALMQLEGSQIRPKPRVTIFASVLHNRAWADNQQFAARRLTTMIFNDHSLISTVGDETVVRLLNFHAEAKNALDALRVAAGLVEHSLQMGTEGAALITRMWPSISWDAQVTGAAMELVRRFVRHLAPREASTVIAYLEQELGTESGDMLRATYLMRQVMGDIDLMTLAEHITIAAQLFIDIATAYHTNKERPPQHRLRRDLDTMTGGLSELERRQVADNTLAITRQVIELGRALPRRRGRAVADQLLQGATAPRCGVDLLIFMGGHFARHEAIPLDLEREEMAHIFGTRSAAMFLRETSAIRQVLNGFQLAFDSNLPSITPLALATELGSLWNSLSLYNQRRIQEQFADGCQQLAAVITIMSEGAHERILSDSGLGRQLETGQRQPRTALETLRWINGYFARKHIRTRT